MDQKKIEELFKNEAFLTELMAKGSAEEAQVYFEENGVGLTLQEIEGLGAVFAKIANGEITQDAVEQVANGELSEAELEEVAGGLLLTGTAIAVIAGVSAGASGAVGALSIIKGWRW